MKFSTSGKKLKHIAASGTDINSDRKSITPNADMNF